MTAGAAAALLFETPAAGAGAEPLAPVLAFPMERDRR